MEFIIRIVMNNREVDSMLNKFKITIGSFIIYLFGLPLMTVSPVFAESEAFIACVEMKWQGNRKAKKNCFIDLARSA
jgi:hypothetical protein